LLSPASLLELPSLPGQLPQFSVAHVGDFSWGTNAAAALETDINAAYDEVVFWRKNVFKLPSGSVGKAFVDETSRLMAAYTPGNPLERIALTAIALMTPLLLQKPFANSTMKVNVSHLQRRLLMWQLGDIRTLLAEGRTIQRRLTNTRRRQADADVTRIFTKLMFEGKTNSALRFLSDQSRSGVLSLTPESRQALLDKHPQRESEDPSILLAGPLQYPDPIIFAALTSDTIRKSVLSTQGSAGPSGGDADHWKRMCLSFKTSSGNLCDSLAMMARRLCTTFVDPLGLRAFLANRLVPLDKNPGLRPVGIGEVHRRIIGKAIMHVLKRDIQNSAGPLQLCVGQEAGCEAAIHAMTRIFANEATDGLLLVDADNAFNRLNRSAALWNIQYTCPPLSTVLINCYRESARLFVTGGMELQSQEGTTQGDPLAMAMYAMAILPLIHSLQGIISQVWFADDAQGAGKLPALRVWWDRLIDLGPKYGYFPKAAKTHLVVKPHLFAEAQVAFSHTGVQISLGQRDLGAAIGDLPSVRAHIAAKVSQWKADVVNLAKVAKSEPHAAHAAFVQGLRHRWTFLQRTMVDIGAQLQPLEDSIRQQYIPSLLGRTVSDAERDMLALPGRYGGAAIDNPVQLSTIKYADSAAISSGLVGMIVQQDPFSLPCPHAQQTVRADRRKVREQSWKNQATELMRTLPEGQCRALLCAQEKGASAVITTRPLKEFGFALPKHEFRDVLLMRYDWPLPNLPSRCPCGQRFDVHHSQICKLGGFVHMRHNDVRDLFGGQCRRVLNDVQIEPPLQHLTGEHLYPASANISDEARVDVRAKGFWLRQQSAFFDVRIFYPHAQCYRDKPLQQVYCSLEKEKKRHYGDRILQVEHGTFTPLVFSSNGGMGRETNEAIKRLACHIADSTGESYSSTMGLLRCRFSFTLLRSAITCLRGSRRLRPSSLLADNPTSLIQHEAGIPDDQE
jgi:hypothetical protein